MIATEGDEGTRGLLDNFSGKGHVKPTIRTIATNICIYIYIYCIHMHIYIYSYRNGPNFYVSLGPQGWPVLSAGEAMQVRAWRLLHPACQGKAGPRWRLHGDEILHGVRETLRVVGLPWPLAQAPTLRPQDYLQALGGKTKAARTSCASATC